MKHTADTASTTGDDDFKEHRQDRSFNPWRIPITASAKAAVEDVLRRVQNYEQHLKLRQRKRKKADQETFEAIVTALACDLMHHYLSGKAEGVYVTRSHTKLGRAGRYSPPVYAKTLPEIMDRMTAPEMGFIVLEIGHEGLFGPAKQTTIRAGQMLINRILENDLSLYDFGVSKFKETIILKRTKEDFWDEGQLIDYKDTPKTNLMREQMAKINGWLEKAELDFDEALLDEGKFIDLYDRSLRRHFTRGSFDSGGRLFGGFWQGIEKKMRRNGLGIDGENSVELDYGQMAPRILYGLSDTAPDFGDIYAIPGYERHRKGIKKLMNAMLFMDSRPTRMPKGLRNHFTPQHKVEDVMISIEAFHPAIKDQFFADVGHKLQFIESQVQVDVLLDLIDQGITALPIHDAILIPRSKVDTARAVMLSAFHQHTGIEGVVSEEEGE